MEWGIKAFGWLYGKFFQGHEWIGLIFILGIGFLVLGVLLSMLWFMGVEQYEKDHSKPADNLTVRQDSVTPSPQVEPKTDISPQKTPEKITPNPEPQPPSSPQAKEQESEDFAIEGDYTVTLGRTNRVIPIEKTRDVRLADAEDSRISAIIEDGRIKVTTELFSGSGDRVKIERSRIVSQSIGPEWDINSNKSAVEVVKNGLPYFQIIRRNKRNVIIFGIFFRTDGKHAIVFSKEGRSTMTQADLDERENQNNWPIKRIFKYPAWEYPGETGNK